MDSAHKSARKFPGYTLADLKQAARYSGRATPEMLQEIADRESGVSKPFVTPQVEWTAAKYNK